VKGLQKAEGPACLQSITLPTPLVPSVPATGSDRTRKRSLLIIPVPTGSGALKLGQSTEETQECFIGLEFPHRVAFHLCIFFEANLFEVPFQFPGQVRKSAFVPDAISTI
jgi:hypothetical protein